MEFDEVLALRKSVRSYTDEPVSEEEIKALIHAAEEASVGHHNDKGYALVDIFQPCVSFNKTNTFKWYRDNTYYVGPEHNPLERQAAMALALQTDRWPLGVLFVNPHPTFEETRDAYGDDPRPLFRRRRDPRVVREYLEANYR